MESKVIRLSEDTIKKIELVRDMKLKLTDDEVLKKCIIDCSYDYLISYIISEYLRIL